MAQVKIYTTPTCAYCKMAKEYFKENKIDYEEFNVAEDAGKRQEMFEKTGQMGVPVIEIGGQIVIGFDKSKVEELLEDASSEEEAA
jgi:glutaredoxin-like YruB-family protein